MEYKMKVAVATDDFVNVTGHVGRCNGFLVYEIEDGKVINVESRENNFTNHKRSEHHSHEHGHEHSHGHSHSALVDGLSDCSHLICTAAGWRMQNDFKDVGKELIFTDEKIAEIAALKLVEGSLDINSDGACHSH
jgi:predicted Fe-Mo cluster-binding NifX family protein